MEIRVGQKLHQLGKYRAAFIHILIGIAAQDALNCRSHHFGSNRFNAGGPQSIEIEGFTPQLVCRNRTVVDENLVVGRPILAAAGF